MCFYAFCEEGKICLKFVNECIYISGKKGSSLVFVDCLIENQDTKPINNIVVLYPHVLSGFETNPKKNGFEACGACAKLAEEKHTYMYTMYYRNFKIEGRTAVLTQPDPNSFTQDLTFEGRLSDIKIAKVPQFNELHYDALGIGEIGFTPFYMLFPDDDPIQAGESRWIRIELQPRETTIITEEEIHLPYLRDLSKKSRFEILSPSRVKHRFKERLERFSRVHKGEEALLADDIKKFVFVKL